MIRALLCAALLAAPATAATLVVNANGYDIDANGRVRRFAGLLVDDDGRIAKVLDRRDREPKLAHGDFRLDAGGRTLLPGLIDAHVHLLQLGQQLRRIDLSEAAEAAQAIAALRKGVAANGARRWLLGRDWRPDMALSLAELDAAFPDRPVWIVASDGQSGFANSVALTEAGVNAADGVLRGAALGAIEAQLPAPSAGEREQALAAALAHLGALGITSVHDIGTTAADWALYRSFADRGALPVRITAYADGMAAMEVISPLRPTGWLYDGRLKLQGIAFRADGSLADRSAWLQAPYADAPGTTGAGLLDEAKAKNLLSRANFLGFQVAVHAEGDAAIAQMLDSFAEIAPAYGPRFRNRIEHLGPLPASAIAPLGKLGMAVTMTPWSAADRATATARLGPARMGSLAPPAALREAGVPVAIAGIASAPSVFHWLAPAIAADGAASLASVGAAAAGADAEVGRLQPGYRADFILLDRDPLAVPTADIGSVQVKETWLGGRRVFARSASNRR